jgi:hypothetical protein
MLTIAGGIFLALALLFLGAIVLMLMLGAFVKICGAVDKVFKVLRKQTAVGLPTQKSYPGHPKSPAFSYYE